MIRSLKPKTGKKWKVRNTMRSVKDNFFSRKSKDILKLGDKVSELMKSNSGQKLAAKIAGIPSFRMYGARLIIKDS